MPSPTALNVITSNMHPANVHVSGWLDGSGAWTTGQATLLWCDFFACFTWGDVNAMTDEALLTCSFVVMKSFSCQDLALVQIAMTDRICNKHKALHEYIMGRLSSTKPYGGKWCNRLRSVFSVHKSWSLPACAPSSGHSVPPLVIIYTSCGNLSADWDVEKLESWCLTRNCETNQEDTPM